MCMCVENGKPSKSYALNKTCYAVFFAGNADRKDFRLDGARVGVGVIYRVLSDFQALRDLGPLVLLSQQ